MKNPALGKRVTEPPPPSPPHPLLAKSSLASVCIRKTLTLLPDPSAHAHAADCKTALKHALIVSLRPSWPGSRATRVCFHGDTLGRLGGWPYIISLNSLFCSGQASVLRFWFKNNNKIDIELTYCPSREAALRFDYWEQCVMKSVFISRCVGFHY